MNTNAGHKARKPYGERAPIPPGPQNCMRTRPNARPCDVCGRTPAILHTPIRQRGRYCAECCPHCGTVRDRAEAMAGMVCQVKPNED
jgi:hypothetical protein